MTAPGRRIWCRVAMGFWLLGGGPAAAQMEGVKPADDARPVYVIREYLLEDLVPSRVKGYMPMTRERFESSIQAMRRTATDQGAGEAQLVSGVFYARYRDRQLVDGRAGLEVVNKYQANSVLSLAPCRLPIRQLHWSELDSAAATYGADVAGDYVVFVDRSSRLLFSWSLRSDEVLTAADSPPPPADAAPSFAISLPPSSINQVVIDLPTGLVPVVDVGDARLVNDEFSDVAVVPAEIDADSERWLLDLGGEHEFTLRIIHRAAASDSLDVARLRQATTYRLSQSAIEVQAELSLEFSSGELDRLVLRTDPNLRVARVRLGERELLPDQITRGARPEEVVLTFDTPLKGARRKLIVEALSPLVMNHPTRLPALRPLDLAWEQATVSLEVPDTLVLKKMVFEDAIETSVEARAGMAGGEFHHFQLFHQDAACEVVIGRPEARTIVTSGTAIAVSLTTLTAQIVADVQAVEGEVYVLDASIASPWKVDSVESAPADALDGTPARRTRGRRIRMQLRQPVSAERQVRILIKAHRTMPAGGKELTAEDFRVIEFRNVATHRRLVSLRAEAPYHLMVPGNPQPNVTPSGLTEEDRELLGSLTSPWDYVDDGTNDTFRVSLTQEKPRYTGGISVEAMADADVLRQAIRIRCQPESSPISSLLVRLSPAPDVPLTWSTDEPDGVLSARLLTPAGPQETATWEIQLRQRRATPFDLTAVCSSPLTGATPIYLASLVEKVDQTGIVTVGAVDGTTLAVNAAGLTAVPIVRPRDDEYPFQRAAYRYDPMRDYTVTVSRRSDARQSVLAWVWSCELASRFQINGATSHQVVFDIQNGGRPKIEITLPATATVQRVRVDESDVSYAKSSGGTQRIVVPLPPRKRFPSVRVDYSTQGEPLRDFTTQEVGWPQIDLFCLKRTWDIWLPPGLHAREDDRFVKTAATSSPNWEERLFGPAMRRRGKRPFDLFSLSDWRTIGQSASHDAGQAAAGFVTAFTNVVVARDTPDQANENLTWGEAISRYEQLRGSASTSLGLRRLWIDANALREQGVTADTVCSTGARPSISRILAGSNLAVVAGPDAILLTSVARLGDFDRDVSATRDRNVYTAHGAGSSFASGLDGAVAPSAWPAGVTASAGPWVPTAGQDAGEFDVGWRHYQLNPAAAPVVQFAVYRPAAYRVMGWGVAFVMIAMVVWFSTRRVKTMVLIVIAAILTLLAPAHLVPVARGLMWGGLVGLLLSYLRGKTTSAPARPALPAGGKVTLAGTAVVLLIALGTWQVSAGEDAQMSAPDATRIYRVVIPVDEEQKPVGEYVFVPRPLFNSLHRPAAAQSSNLAWLLRSAAYETALALRSDADGLVEADVSAVYELETFQMGTSVAFPLGRDGVRSLKDVKVDGQAAELQWNVSGEALEIVIARPGRHRLELGIRPVLRNDAESSGFALRVPKFAGARLKVRPSARIEGIELPAALGAIELNESLGTIDADLGPTDMLAVRWPLSIKAVAESIPMTAVERFWLRIQPSSVVLEGQFLFTVPRGGISQVRLLADPRFKLSQLAPSQPANYELESGPIPSIVVRFDEPGENQVFVHATFLMTDTSGLGNIFLPRLAAVADVKGSSTLGLSFAPSLEVELVADPPLQAILPAEFLPDWKDPTDSPQLAYRLSERGGGWHVTSRPLAVRPQAQQLSNWSIGSTQAALAYSADLDLGGQPSFQQRLRVPPRIEIDRLEVFRGDVTHGARWTRAGDIVTVFFEQAIQDRCRLVIEGQTPTGFREQTLLPLVSLLDVESQANRIVVRRRPDVLIENLDATGLVVEPRETTASIPSERRNGRIVGAYSVPDSPDEQPPAGLLFLARRNQPRIAGRIEHYLSFGENNVWLADTDVTLEVTSGVVDEVRMALPVGWSESLTITPEINHEIVGTGADRVLALRPDSPIRDLLRLRIHCELRRATVALSELPLIRILNESQMQQYVVLPARQGEAMISWETTGLQQIEKPTSRDASLPETDSTWYRVEGQRVTAVVHNVGRLGGTPQVQLADINVVCNRDRTTYGVASFDVIPLQMTELQLVVPSGFSIAHVDVAGVPVTLRTDRQGRVWIPLGPEQLPQRIDVVFFGRLSSIAALPGDVISAPSLADVPVEQTLWTVRGPVGAVVDEALLEHTRTDEVEQARIRAGAASLILQMAETLTPPVAEAGFESWTRTWQRRRDRAARVAAGTQGAQGDAETERFETAAWDGQVSGNSRGEPTRLAVQGASSSINVQFTFGQTSDIGMRAGISAVIAWLALLLGLAMRRFRVWECVERSWHALGVSAGIVWWLWFTPSFVGLVIMAIFLTAAIWPIRKSRRAL